MSAQSLFKSRSTTRNSAQAGVPSPTNSIPAAQITHFQQDSPHVRACHRRPRAARPRRGTVARSLLRGVLRARVCTYSAGFEPIRDLPSLASLPPPLFFPPAHLSHGGNNTSSSSTGQLGGSNGTLMPVKHSHSGSQQSDSSYSNSSGSAGRGASHASHASQASHASSASGSSYASSSAGSYASAQSGDPPTSTWAKKKWFSLPLPNALR
ncbi:hypothetical protein C8F04DRAFT_1141464 [Mycena alexandri]|uniref:Uncharacterized protein n=1 Tax=Mycena alexandri TaxID=1745969 RepID=A0AAD6S521_9AGAR|nr:hypothetical protein C8F04DRAFT_1141464 [Mycena alexandri]